MRGIASGPALDTKFFIIMDRLRETLDVRAKTWAARYTESSKGGLFRFGTTDATSLRQLLLERIIVAYDLSAALSYMHANKLIYRDIKNENIGFDVRGDVKIFDFGLSRSIPQELKAKDSMGRPTYGYNLTPGTGSIPFMAPEIAACKPYDEKCDVFSFAILLWEILALDRAFKDYSYREFFERVVRAKQRPLICRKWSPMMKLLLQEAWDDDPTKRPAMQRISSLIRGDLNDMAQGNEEVIFRTMHMKNRSFHSMRDLGCATRDIEA
jgi:serine/threonine protein kinase